MSFVLYIVGREKIVTVDLLYAVAASLFTGALLLRHFFGERSHWKISLTNALLLRLRDDKRKTNNIINYNPSNIQ